MHGVEAWTLHAGLYDGFLFSHNPTQTPDAYRTMWDCALGLLEPGAHGHAQEHSIKDGLHTD